MICDKCNGTGYIKEEHNISEFMGKQYNLVNEICPKCHGTKEVDWIEAIVGKKPDPEPYGFTLPKIRNKYPKLMAKDLVDVQPMTDTTFFKDILK